ncbi:MAG: HAMP domain-containing histidine kinase [Deltaproteobacteria bacterium]|nr:HAMP domain-containing histidine kinase [Deltaproteobacteria bacterium]
MTKHCRRHGRRLFWRIYVHGLLLVLAVGAAVSGLAVVAGPTSPWQHRRDALAGVLSADLAPRLRDPSALTAQLAVLERTLHASLSVYRADGTELARAGARPPGPLSLAQVRRLGERRVLRSEGIHVLAVPLSEDAYLLATGPDVGHGRFLAAVGVLLLVAALISYPLTRTIAGPLERLTETARRLADGDLAARSEVSRDDEVGTLARALDDMAFRLETRIRSDRELLANVSHEFRTPLARLRVALELCEEEENPKALAGHLAGIAQDIAELDRLVADVLASTRLDLAAGEGPQLRPDRTAVDLGALAREAAERFSGGHPERKLRLAFPDALPGVFADAALLRRVFDNVLENAARYSEPAAPVDLRVNGESGWLTVVVADRGIGVPEQELPRLFEPFFRTERSRSRAAGGTGLGLTLCKRIVEAHGGTIAAGPNAGGGLVLTFRLPADTRPDRATS